jgi:predicted TIM-barrel fold metal-dependent hydrolase
MKFAYEFLGADRLLFASDHPWVEPKLIRDTFDSLHLPPDDREKIYTLNARKLFRL